MSRRQVVNGVLNYASEIEENTLAQAERTASLPFIVEGLGSPASFTSAPHGAGRKMSRTQARKSFTAEDLAARMKGKTWLGDQAKALVDEIPDSYKDIGQVIRDSADLVRVVSELRQIVNYKGT